MTAAPETGFTGEGGIRAGRAGVLNGGSAINRKRPVSLGNVNDQLGCCCGVRGSVARKVELAQVGFGVGVRTVFDGKYLWKSSLDPRDVEGVLKPLGRGWPGFQCESQPCLKE